MFVYHQDSGRFVHRSGQGSRLLATGYAGAPGFVNDPSSDHLSKRGPIPKGYYRLRVVKHPRFAFPAIFCEPSDANQMFGRSGFYIHGDNRHGNRTASTGCIILSRFVRHEISDAVSGGDVSLIVVGWDDEATVREARSTRPLLPSAVNGDVVHAIEPAPLRALRG